MPLNKTRLRIKDIRVEEIKICPLTTKTIDNKKEKKIEKKRIRFAAIPIAVTILLLICVGITQYLKDNSPPKIFIKEPKVTTGGRKVSEEQITIIRGQASDSSGIAWIAINDLKIPFQPNGGFTYNVRLDKKKNIVKIQAMDKKNNLATEIISIDTSETAQSGNTPALRVLSIGVSKYRNHSLNLQFADHDAIKIAEMENKLFKKVYTTILINKQADREGILKAVKDIADKASTYGGFSEKTYLRVKG